eukprot:4243418-Pleurochrysis_carterae.AAC.5
MGRESEDGKEGAKTEKDARSEKGGGRERKRETDRGERVREGGGREKELSLIHISEPTRRTPI